MYVCYETRMLCRLFPTAIVLGFNLCGRGVVPRKCTPRKIGTVLEPSWNLAGTFSDPSPNLAETLLELFWNLRGSVPEPCWNSSGTLQELCRNLVETSWNHLDSVSFWCLLNYCFRFVFVVFLLRFNGFLLCLMCWVLSGNGGQGAHLKMKIFLELVAGTYSWLESRIPGAPLKPF